jgi:hypothetical protein
MSVNNNNIDGESVNLQKNILYLNTVLHYMYLDDPCEFVLPFCNCCPTDVPHIYQSIYA